MPLTAVRRRQVLSAGLPILVLALLALVAAIIMAATAAATP